MKKQLLTLALVAPLTLKAQAAVERTDFGSIFAFLFAVGICILIFLALRQIMLWYWKVDTIIQNQEKQIELMEEQIKAQSKFYNYMENKIHSIKESFEYRNSDKK